MARETRGDRNDYEHCWLLSFKLDDVRVFVHEWTHILAVPSGVPIGVYDYSLLNCAVAARISKVRYNLCR